MKQGEVGRVLLTSYMLGYKPEVMEAARRHVFAAAPPPVAFAKEEAKSKRKKKRNGKKPPREKDNEEAPKEQGEEDELKAALKREMDKFISLAGNNHLQAELNRLKAMNAVMMGGEEQVVVKPRWRTPKESGYSSDNSTATTTSSSTTAYYEHDQRVIEQARRALYQAAKLI